MHFYDIKRYIALARLFLSCSDQRETDFKTESTRKLSNFNFQWAKTLYQNNSKDIAFFFLHFSRAKDVVVICNNCHQRKFLMGTRENECQISQNYIFHVKFYLCFHNSCDIWHSFSPTPKRNFLWCYLAFKNVKRNAMFFKLFRYKFLSIDRLRIKITQFPGGFRLKRYRNEYVTLSDFKLTLLVREFVHND